VSASSGVLGLATVFSSAPSTIVQFAGTEVSRGCRLGVAIANDTDSAEQYVIFLNDTTGHEQGRTMFFGGTFSTIPPAVLAP
jgi:hypothetical protein